MSSLRRHHNEHDRPIAGVRRIGRRRHPWAATSNPAATAAGCGQSAVHPDSIFDAVASAVAAVSGNAAFGVVIFHALDGLRRAPLDRKLLQKEGMRQIHPLFQPRIPP